MDEQEILRRLNEIHIYLMPDAEDVAQAHSNLIDLIADLEASIGS